MELLQPYELGRFRLQNRMVMSPLTRCRAIDNVPNQLMATYYGQRAGAGLIITEGTAPSPNGLGYARIPGAYSDEQTAGWRAVAEAAHAGGAAIFMQLMHTGRVSHPHNMPEGAEIVAPSPIAVSGEMYTDQAGPQPYPAPREMNQEDIRQAVGEFVASARNAIAAGMNGVELHGANGYLIDQFLNPASNQRTDDYGGSVANRCRFAVEVAQAVAEAIGPDRLGIRVSPYGVFNDAEVYEQLDDTYAYLADALRKIGLAYMHIVDHSSMGAPEVPARVKELIRDRFGGTIILSGGYDGDRAEQDLRAGLGHLVAFGRPFLANPDLPRRIREGAPLNDPDPATFYTPGEKGYIDYPFLHTTPVEG